VCACVCVCVCVIARMYICIYVYIKFKINHWMIFHFLVFLFEEKVENEHAVRCMFQMLNA